MVEVHRVIHAPPARCWAWLTEFDRWPDWGPSVRAVEPPGAAVTLGLQGRVQTAAGPWVPFEITEYTPLTEVGGSWAWRVGGVAATTHAVAPHPRGARVTFGVPAWAAPYALVCQLALRRIARGVEASGPGRG